MSEQTKHELRIFTSAFDITDFCLVMTEADLNAVCKYANISKEVLGDIQIDGQVDFFFTPTGGRLAVLRIKDDGSYTEAEMIALIVHEITHIKQRIMLDINEKEPSHEFEAYMMQDLTLQILQEYFRQKELAKGD